MIVTSSLPLAASVFVKASGHSTDVAALASILIGTSADLTIFGTHTIINSFISPFLYLFTSPFISLLLSAKNGRNNNNNNIKPFSRKTAGTIFALMHVCVIINHFVFDWRRAVRKVMTLGCLSLKWLLSPGVHFQNENESHTTGNVFTSVTKIINNENNFHRPRRRSSSSLFSENLNKMSSNAEEDSSHGAAWTESKERNVTGSISSSCSENTDVNCFQYSRQRSDSDSGFDEGKRSESVTRENSTNGSLTEDEEDVNGKMNNNNRGIISKFYSSYNNNNDNSCDNNIETCSEIAGTGSIKSSDFKECLTPKSEVEDTQIRNQLKHEDKIPTPKSFDKHLDKKSQKIRTTNALFCKSRTFHTCFSIVKFFTAGIFLGLSVYLRPDSCLLLSVIVFTQLLSLHLKGIYQTITSTYFCSFLLGGIAGVSIGIFDDLYFYQGLVFSPWQWFHFNVLTNLSTHLFGSSKVTFYISKVFTNTTGMSVLSLFYIVLYLHHRYRLFKGKTDKQNTDKAFHVVKSKHKKESSMPLSNNSTSFSSHKTYTLTFIILLIIYSCFGHKEERFLHDVIVLFFINFAIYLTICVHQMLTSNTTKRVVCFLIVVSFSFSQWKAMPDSKNSGVNQCLDFVSRRDDVRGLFMDSNFPYSFSYSILHQNIPLLTVIKNEYVEFDKNSVVMLNRSCFVNSQNCNSSYVSVNSISNIILHKNAHGLIKHLLERFQRYNYAIIKTSKSFFVPAYERVYQTKEYSVWSSTGRKDNEQWLKRRLSEVKFDAKDRQMNEYESEVLKQTGNFWTALQKMEIALEDAISQKHINVLASMVYCFDRIGYKHQAKLIFKMCLKYGTREECSSGQESRVPALGSKITI